MIRTHGAVSARGAVAPVRCAGARRASGPAPLRRSRRARRRNRRSDEDVRAPYELARRYPTVRITPQMLLGEGSASSHASCISDLSRRAAVSATCCLRKPASRGRACETRAAALFAPDVALVRSSAVRDGNRRRGCALRRRRRALRERYGSARSRPMRDAASRRAEARFASSICSARRASV